MELRNGLWRRPESTVRVDFSSCLAQQRAHKRFRPGNRVCLPWGRGVGKSWAMRQFFYLLIAEFGQVVRTKADGSSTRGVRITLAMPTLTQARRVHIGASPGLLDELAGQWSFLGGVMNFATWRVHFPAYHSWIQFVTTDRPDSARGIRTDVGAFDEADDIDPEFYHAVAGPMFSEPHSLNMTLVAGTPKRGRNGFLYMAHKSWPELLPGKAFSFHATGYDTKHVLPERIEEQRLTTPDELFKREWLCDFDATEGRVYGEFNEQFHVRKPPEGTQFSQILVGGDHGKVDPTVLLVIGIAGKGRDMTAYVLEEFYEAGRDPFHWQAIAKRIVERYPHALWYCDPAGYGTSNALYQVVGARVRDVDKSAGSVEAGISVVRRWLKVQTSAPQLPVRTRALADDEPPEQRESDQYARLYVHPRCRHTIREFGLYRHKRDRHNGETLLEDILPGNDHCFVAGTLVETSTGPQRIETVPVGATVHTRGGLRRVLASGVTRLDAPLWRLELSNGASLYATPDHRIWTVENGWVRMDALRYGVTLLGWESMGAVSGFDIASERGRLAPVFVVRASATARREPVFCLTVEEHHEFFAGGVLVANCMDSLRYPLFNHFPDQATHYDLRALPPG